MSIFTWMPDFYLLVFGTVISQASFGILLDFSLCSNVQIARNPISSNWGRDVGEEESAADWSAH